MCHEEGHGHHCMGPGHYMRSFFEGGQWMPRRFLHPVSLLLLAESPCHGYELMGRLKDFGMDPGQMDPSVLYRLLRHLERSGLTESTLDDTGAGPARKVYNLTLEGREVLDLWAANIDSVSSVLAEFKKRYEGLSKK